MLPPRSRLARCVVGGLALGSPRAYRACKASTVLVMRARAAGPERPRV